MAIINGWGRGTWDEGAWGTALPINLSSVGAITSGLGTVTVDAEANVTLTGTAMGWPQAPCPQVPLPHPDDIRGYPLLKPTMS